MNRTGGLLLSLLLAGTVAQAQPVPLPDENQPPKGKQTAELVPAQDRPALEAKAQSLGQQAARLVQQGSPAKAKGPAEESVALYRRLYPVDRYPAGHPD